MYKYSTAWRSCYRVTINGQNVKQLRVTEYASDEGQFMTINCPFGANTSCIIQSHSRGAFDGLELNADNTDTVVMLGKTEYDFVYTDIHVNNSKIIYIDCARIGGCNGMELYINTVCHSYIILTVIVII